jgi:hypothetical protein
VNLSISQGNSVIVNTTVAYDATLPTMNAITATTGPQKTTFSFSATDTGTNGVYGYECNLDSATYVPCASPMVYYGLANATHTFYARAKDYSGNTSSVQTSGWTQGSYSTVALYQLDDFAPLSDMSSYATALTDPNTIATGSGQFSQGRTFATTGSKYVYAADATAQRATGSIMSAEAYIYPTGSLLASNTYILNKSGQSSNYGWYLAYRGSGSTMNLVFAASLDGTTAPTQVVSPATCTYSANSWTHVAVTWNAGVVKFYCNGVYKGMQTIGVPGTANINLGATPLNIGRNEAITPTYFNGVIDAVRVSQTLRDTNSSYPVPTIAPMAD